MAHQALQLGNHALLDEYNVSLQTILIRSGRTQFRRIFIKKYPFFIYLLHNSIPQISASEKLLCMLTFLKQSTDDISAILGICRKSVKQSHFRLYQKIKASANVSIEEFIYQLSSSEQMKWKSIESFMVFFPTFAKDKIEVNQK